jgi:hypothetical protein
VAFDVIADAAYSIVATAPSPATSGTTLVVTAGEGARFPSSGSFDVIIWPTASNPIWGAGSATGGNFEICRATRSSDTLTLTRAQYGTTARSVQSGDQVAQAITAEVMQQIQYQMGITPIDLTTSATIYSGYGCYKPSRLSIATGISLTIEDTAILEVGL